MRNFFSIIVIFAILLVGGGWVYMRQADQRAKEQAAKDLSDARRTLAQKARAAANEDDEDSYLRATRAAIDSYKDELSKRVFSGDKAKFRDPEGYKKTVDLKFEKKEIDEAKRKSMLEGYDIVKEAYDTLMGGSWKPILTAKGSADTRLDLYTLKLITDQDNQPILEGKFLFWGIEDSTDVRWGQLSTRIWTTEMGKVKENGKMVEKEVEKVLGKTEGEAQPHIIIQTPHRYIDEFPSFVSIGYLWLSRPLPYEAKYIDIEYTYTTKTAGGGEVASALKWEKMLIPATWKLKEGQTWDADVVEATEEEIAGKNPDEEKKDEEKEKAQ